MQDFYKKPATCRGYAVVNVEKLRQTAIPVPVPQTAKSQPYGFYSLPQPPPAAPTSHSKPAKSPAKPAEHKKKPACPEGLKEYIRQSFSKCNSDEERLLMEKMTKEVIARVKSAGNLMVEAWETKSLPLLPREKEAAVFANPSHSSQKAAQILAQPKPVPETYQIPRKVPPKDPVKPVAEPPRAPVSLPGPEPHKEHRDVPRTRPKAVVRPVEHSSYDDEDDLERLAQAWKVVGTSTALEKRYLRLTDAPDPATVRPEAVIRKALSVFKEKWKKDEIGYSHLSDQLRAIRQDLKVQRIKNNLTVEVYQVHARLALEAGDLDQFISCMGSLFELFAEGLEGKKTVGSFM